MTPSAMKSRPAIRSDDVPAGLVGAGDPLRAVDDARVDEEADAGGLVLAQRTRPDVALDQQRVLGEVVLAERLDLGRRDLRLEPLHVDVAVAGHADRQRSRPCRRGGAA